MSSTSVVSYSGKIFLKILQNFTTALLHCCQNGSSFSLPKMPVPTPRQSRKPSTESQTSQYGQAPATPRDVLEKFDPLAMPTSQAEDDAINLLEESTRDHLSAVEDVWCSRESDKFQPVDEANQCPNSPSADDESYSGLSQLSVTSGKILDHHDGGMELSSEPHEKSDCCSPDAGGDVKRVSSSSSQQSEKYLKLWEISGCHMQNVAEAGLSPEAVMCLPLQREFIKSEESLTLSPPTCAFADVEDVVFSTPPVPKKRSTTQLPMPNQSANASDITEQSLMPFRNVPHPLDQDAEHKISAGISGEKMAEDASIVGRETPAAVNLVVPGLSAVPQNDSNSALSVLPCTASPRVLPIEEEQIITMSFHTSRPDRNVSPTPCPRPRESPQLSTASRDNNSHLPSPSHIQLPPLIMPTAAQQPPSSTPSSIPSPLDKVIAVGGVNVLAVGVAAAARGNLKTSTARPISPRMGDIATPSSPRTPPIPPPKHRKPSAISNVTLDFDTTDDELDIADKDSKLLICVDCKGLIMCNFFFFC